MAVKNTRVIFNSYPKDYPVPGETLVVDNSQTIDIDNVPLNGGVLFKVLALSIDPYQRGRMNKVTGYRLGFTIGEAIDNHGVGRVVRSENSKLKPGDLVYGFFIFQQYVIWKELPQAYRVLANEAKIPLQNYVGIVGMPGKTAFYGWRAYFEEKSKAGGTLFVSTAAGPVGCFVAQLAKKAGLKVIGATGSDDKVDFLKEIGVDVAVNYKKVNLEEVLAKEGPIDMYWDHVGGNQLDAALANMNNQGVVVVCGQIASYNGTHPPIKNFPHILFKQITVHGYMVGRLEDKYVEEFYKTVPSLVANREIQHREHVYKGLEEVPQAMLDVQKGNNTGKAIIVLE